MRKCKPQEVIKFVPDIQTVNLPSFWFSDLNDHNSVFSSFYNWMLNNDRIPSRNKESLHNRTYVGEVLFKKLVSAEKKRLKKRLKLKGEELDRAVAWSDLNSGPKTEIGGSKISGDIILVVPESSQDALNKFSVKRHQKKNAETINKIRTNAAGGTFYRWLVSQIDRPDRIGDAAKDANADQNFPREKSQIEEIKSYLNSHGACSAAIESFKEGWLEYIQQYPERIVPFAWCSECGERLEIKDAIFAYSSESLELYVLDSDCLKKYLQFDKMISCPLSDVSRAYLENLVEKKELSKVDSDALFEDLKSWGIIPVVDEGYVYFIKSEKTHSIKIGYTSGQVKKRLNSLQTAHPYKLHLLATLPGTREYEKSLHERFSSFRLKGEWFDPHPDLLAFISVVRKGQLGVNY